MTPYEIEELRRALEHAAARGMNVVLTHIQARFLRELIERSVNVK